jgi:hypothetical protein
MDTIPPNQTTTSTSQAKEILFHNGSTALSVTATANAPASDVLNALKIQQPKALMIVIGGAGELDNSLSARLTFLCNLGIASVAVEEDVMIIDGGKQAVVMTRKTGRRRRKK